MSKSLAKQIRKVIVLANKRKEEALGIVEEIQAYLHTRKIEYSVQFTVDPDDTSLQIPEKTDLAICLGGDGTVLSCARLLHSHGIPMLAVNLGTFGFITEISKNEWIEAFEA